VNVNVADPDASESTVEVNPLSGPPRTVNVIASPDGLVTSGSVIVAVNVIDVPANVLALCGLKTQILARKQRLAMTDRDRRHQRQRNNNRAQRDEQQQSPERHTDQSKPGRQGNR
jgi:hypothetical protein